MKILNEQDEVIENPDLSLGHLVEETEEVYHPEIPMQPRETKKVVIWQGKNGASVYENIEVKPYRPGVPAWTEEVKFQRYVLYTEEELAQQAQQEEEMRLSHEKSELEAQKRKELEEKLEKLPEQVASQQESIDEIFVVVAELAATQDEEVS